ncbi:uncharacterized protein RAG0_05528 [Rhynchosporium agropyri]|uniref:Uncharacterized protein n=1 Tax=Rhynchosporium agropyri TaxID=914238 RepID=A0A1E1KDH4_9HELO|nr:uncharacterized protein RAG0_05528 [Rhynchosporium agropyri]
MPLGHVSRPLCSITSPFFLGASTPRDNGYQGLGFSIASNMVQFPNLAAMAVSGPITGVSADPDPFKWNQERCANHGFYQDFRTLISTMFAHSYLFVKFLTACADMISCNVYYKP